MNSTFYLDFPRLDYLYYCTTKIIYALYRSKSCFQKFLLSQRHIFVFFFFKFHYKKKIINIIIYFYLFFKAQMFILFLLQLERELLDQTPRHFIDFSGASFSTILCTEWAQKERANIIYE